jgi:F-type H+-transporting ATPase subunit b
MNGLGIDWKILLGQIINFLILLWLLKKFAYKPFLSMLSKRQKQIEEGIKKTEEAQISLDKIKSLAKEVADAQDKRSKIVMATAVDQANEKTKMILAAAEKEKQKIVENAKIAMEREHERLHDVHQRQTVDLAFTLAKKALGETITKDQDKKIIERLASDIQE